MSDWRTTDSPRLRMPMELRELTAPGQPERRWEVQDLRKGAMFIVVFRASISKKPLSEAVIDHAVCVAVEESMITPPDKEPGETYDVEVTKEHLDEARALG